MPATNPSSPTIVYCPHCGKPCIWSATRPDVLLCTNLDGCDATELPAPKWPVPGAPFDEPTKGQMNEPA